MFGLSGRNRSRTQRPVGGVDMPAGWQVNQIPSGLLITTDDGPVVPALPTDAPGGLAYYDLVVASLGPVPTNVVAALARLARSLPAETQQRLRLVASGNTDMRPLADLAGALRLPVVRVETPRMRQDEPRAARAQRTNGHVPGPDPDYGLTPPQPPWGELAVEGPPPVTPPPPAPPPPVAPPPGPVPSGAGAAVLEGFMVDSEGRIRLAPPVADQGRSAAGPPVRSQPAPTPSPTLVRPEPLTQAAPEPPRARPEQRTAPPPVTGVSATVPVMPSVAPPLPPAAVPPGTTTPATAPPGGATPAPVPPAAAPPAVAPPVAGPTPPVVVSASTDDGPIARPVDRRVVVPRPSGQSLIRPAELPAAATRWRDHTSSPEDRRQFRASLGWRYDAAAQYVTRLLSDRPVLRVGEDDGLAPDLAAVQFFANSGDHELLATVRSAALSTQDSPLLSCLVSGLRRLPALVGPVIRGGEADPRQLAAYQPGTELIEPGPLLALTDVTAPLRGNAELLIWSSSARQLQGLIDTKASPAVMFLPGTTLRVLGRDGGEEVSQILMMEVPPNRRDHADPARDERIIERLRSVAAARAGRPAETAVDLGWSAPWLQPLPGFGAAS